MRTLGAAGWAKLAGLALLTALLLAGEGLLAHRLLAALRAKEDLAPFFVVAITQRLVALVFLVSLSMLFFSNVTTSIATLYLSRDLDLLLATPVGATRVFALKLGETVVNSSYMVVLFTAPILVACGLAFSAPGAYYLLVPVALVLLVLPPAAAGILLTLLLMRWLPARRTHQMLTAVGLMLAVSFVTLLRLLSPERLLRSTATEDLAQVLRDLTVPAQERLPSTWAADLVLAGVRGEWGEAAPAALRLALLAAGSLALVLAVARAAYFRGVSAAHEAGRRRRSRRGVGARRLGLAGRDRRLFFRDPAQWSQLLLLAALVVVYVFNVTALPQDLLVAGAFLRIRDLVAWINVGLAGLVLAAVGMRFVLPSISSEGGAFWIVASSPLDRRRYVLGKLLLFLPAMLLFALTLVALSGRALAVDATTYAFSLGVTAVVTTTLTVMGVGLGAALPSFRLENPAQFVLTGGGILYGVLSLLYVVAVVALEARPFFWRLLVQAGLLDAAQVEAWPYYATILALSLAAGGGSLAWGLRRAARLEA